MFAQHLLLQTCGLGDFEKIHEAAGSWRGITNNASTTVNKIAAVFRITQSIAQRRPPVSYLFVRSKVTIVILSFELNCRVLDLELVV